MPLYRLPNAKLIYFAHVPKCAGTAIERYFGARFGVAAMLDARFGGIPTAQRWSLTSPQHMPETVRQRYLPDGFIDASFATVRHPATRLRSVFLFQREIERRIPADRTFEQWLDTIAVTLATMPHAFDGHLRPMADYVPETAQVFRIETGLDAVVTWVDAQSGSTDPEAVLKPLNVLQERLTFENRPIPQVELTPGALEHVAELYASDYARFDYSVMPEAQEVQT